jgi:two-component system chemotaxis response regulator CheB
MTQDPGAAPPTKLIVIGASAGGLLPLRTIAEALPAGLAATVLVVMHVSSTARSLLPDILRRATRVGVAAATDDMIIELGQMLVAPPDRHLIVHDGHVRLTRGPRENGHRPAVDPLFRSAARFYGAACCGVILSGARDDGALGLAEVKRCGGVTIVQDPDEAPYPGMPSSAIAGTAVDFTLGAAAIGPELVRLVNGGTAGLRRAPAPPPPALDDEPIGITCPECGGLLSTDAGAAALSFRCHVGHAYSPRSLMAEHSGLVERAMWTAVRSLEDRAALLRRMATHAEDSGRSYSARQFLRQADAADEQAGVIREAIAAIDDASLTLPEGGQEVPE